MFDPLRLSSGGLGEGVSTRELVASERRLFLLACSRAAGRLLVTAAVEGTEGEEDRPSRFLTELGRPIRAIEARAAAALPARAGRRAARRRAEPGRLSDAARRRRRAPRAAGRPGERAGVRLVPDADPDRWWGLLEPTSWAAPARAGRLELSPSS